MKERVCSSARDEWQADGLEALGKDLRLVSANVNGIRAAVRRGGLVPGVPPYAEASQGARAAEVKAPAGCRYCRSRLAS